MAVIDGAAAPAYTAAEGARVTLRVLVLADDALTAQALGAVMRRSPSLRVETALLGDRLAARLARWPPDVLLCFAGHVNCAMLERLASVREDMRVPFCVVARSIEPGALRDAFFAKPDGMAVLLRGTRPAAPDLFRTIVQLVGGRTVLSAQLLESLLAECDADDDPLACLTPAEHEVLELLALGLRNVAIARRLRRSEKSVEKLVGSVFGKLQLAADGDPTVDRRVTAARVFLSHSGAASA